MCEFLCECHTSVTALPPSGGVLLAPLCLEYFGSCAPAVCQQGWESISSYQVGPSLPDTCISALALTRVPDSMNPGFYLTCPPECLTGITNSPGPKSNWFCTSPSMSLYQSSSILSSDGQTRNPDSPWNPPFCDLTAKPIKPFQLCPQPSSPAPRPRPQHRQCTHNRLLFLLLFLPS